ncbi:MAG: alpha/beta hydrolase [Halioglobus sp.]
MSSYNDYWFKSSDGLNLYARDYPSGSAVKAPATTIVCIPGLTRNSADFAALAPYLSKRFRVLAVDLRGRGKSEYDTDPNNYVPAVYVEDVQTLLDGLGLASVILIGTSLGGLVSMLLSAMQPQRVASIIVNDIGPEVQQSGLERIKSYVSARSSVASWPEAVRQTREILSREYPNFGLPEWEEFTRNLYREGCDGCPILNYDAGISLPMEQSQPVVEPADLWPAFAAITSIPMLLFRGELSDILSRDCATRMLQRHSNMEFVEVPDCGHAPLLTEVECLHAIENFLSPNKTSNEA